MADGIEPDFPPAVPRETRQAIAALFAARTPVAERFVEHLVTSGVQRGLIGPREVPRIWERHVLNCAAMRGLLATEAEVADVGSGAGLPGVALAIARVDLHMTLVEPLLRRVTWLKQVVEDLELERVTVIRGRAEELRGSLCVDAVTARAVAPLPTLAAWCLPLLRPGGRLLAIKGSTAQDELFRSVPALRAAGAVRWAVESCDAAGLDLPTVVTVVTKAGSTCAGHPPPAVGRDTRPDVWTSTRGSAPDRHDGHGLGMEVTDR